MNKQTENAVSQTISLRAQSAWILFAKIAGFGFSFLLPLLVVRYLSQEKVGLYRESFLVIVNAAAILPFGFSMSAYYYLARETERRAAAVFNILLFNFIVGGLACFALWLYPQMLGSVLRSDELTLLAPKIGLVIWVWMFSMFLEIVPVANGEARLASVFIIFAQLSKTFLMVGAVFLFATIEAFIYAAILQGLLQSAILLVYLHKKVSEILDGVSPGVFLEQMIYAIPFGLTAVLWILQTDVHNYFVAYKFSSAEFAVYAYGCFQLPLIAMLAESIASVLIPRMSELEKNGETGEMIRLTTRAMQKLAFFYFPIYVFLLITAKTFIVTLFTVDYLASVPIFIINLTLLPLGILITDPIVRARKELGRFLLTLRAFILAVLIAALYIWLPQLDMSGMLALAVGAVIIEKAIAEIIIARKLGFGRKDFYRLKTIGKTAVVSVLAGIVVYFVHVIAERHVFDFGRQLAAATLQTTDSSVLNFVGGGLTLSLCALVFAPIYLTSAYLSGIVEDDEKQLLASVLKKFGWLFGKKPIPKTNAPNPILEN